MRHLALFLLLAANLFAVTDTWGPYSGTVAYYEYERVQWADFSANTSSIPDNATITSAWVSYDVSNQSGTGELYCAAKGVAGWWDACNSIAPSQIGKTAGSYLDISFGISGISGYGDASADVYNVVLHVTYTVNSPPTTGNVSGIPANFHYGVWFNISATVSDADGYANISYWHLLVNYGVDGNLACYFQLFHNSNQLKLCNDACSDWGTLWTMGTANYPANSQCQVDLANSSYSNSTTNSTVNLRIRFMPGALVRNPMNSYLWVTDAAGNSGWQGPKQTGYVRTRSKLIVRSN